MALLYRSPRHVYLGHDFHERRAFDVAVASIARSTPIWPSVHAIDMDDMRERGLYSRPTTVNYNGKVGSYYDEISEAPMSTGHAIARFLVPALQEWKGWALFVDSDIVVRRDLGELFKLADPAYAVMCVQHSPSKQGGGTPTSEKKGGHIQQFYARKNWSSVVLWNCGHPANRMIGVQDVNGRPGRDLHAFYWLEDSDIGALPREWNYLVDIDADTMPLSQIAIAHFTLGLPDVVEMKSREAKELATEWAYLKGIVEPMEVMG